MTALKQYEKLEAAGLWREAPATQRREVYVNFGDTTLIVRNQNDEVLSHWSLPAVHRINPGKMPALFSPTDTASETLEIDDITFVDAVEKIRAAIDRRRPRPGRLRLWIFLGLSLVILLLALFWLPGALERHTIRVVPFETRRLIGEQVLSHITRLTGKSCATPLGLRAVQKLEKRLLVEKRGRILLLADGIAKSAHLPGGFILLNKTLVEDHEQIEVAAGYVLLEQVRATQTDPLAQLLDHAGAIETFRLLTTGNLDDAALRAYAQKILVTNNELPAIDVLISGFEHAKFSSGPLAYAIDISGETTLPLIEGDPYLNKPYPPLLSDSDWVRLQAICGG
ncbi:MAG: hypothetical protein ACI861_001109 [Paracoccaceae bacterium]|jgi:hypothetical protein